MQEVLADHVRVFHGREVLRLPMLTLSQDPELPRLFSPPLKSIRETVQIPVELDICPGANSPAIRERWTGRLDERPVLLCYKRSTRKAFPQSRNDLQGYD
jgi:hypothetical protein